MAVLITRQPQSTCVAPNSDARFALGCEGDIASFDWQYSTDLETWYDIGLDSNIMVLRNVQTENTHSYYRCKIEDSTDGTYIYSATVELFVFDEEFVRKVVRGGDMFLAMVDVYTSLRQQTSSDMSSVISEIQAALNQKSSADHVHDTRYYRQEQTDEKYLTGASISDKTITFTYGDNDTTTVTTPDYRVQNTPSATTKAYITGTATATESVGTQIFDTSIYLDTTAGHLVAPYFDGNALKDTLGQQIDATYIKNLSIVDKVITFTKGDNTTNSITTPDYRVQSVPSGTTKAYLVGDANTTDHTGTLIKDTSVYLDTTAGHLTATLFNGPATKLNDGTDDYDVGSATKGVYFDDGVPVAMTYSLNKTVPSDAVFTDTTYTAGTGLSLSSGGEFSHSTSGVTAGTYKSVTVNSLGHVTAGTNPTTVSGYGITDAYTKTEVDNKISGLVNSAPETLDTLKELADALGNDANFSTTIATSLGNKVDKSDGIVGLSISDKTITYTKGNNTSGTITTPDYRVTNNVGNTTKAYLVGSTSNTDTTGTLIKDTGVYLDTTAGHLTATQFNGALNGKANTAGKLHSAVNITVGGETVSFDGSTAISFSLADIGAQASGNYAGSSTSGGAATSANKLNTDAGSATQPVYFSSGVPVATTYALNKTVPSDAVFTDTNTKVTNTALADDSTTKVYITGTSSSSTNTGTQNMNSKIYFQGTTLTAPTFSGALSGKATSAGKLQNGSTDYAIGSATQPIYFSDGVPVATTYSLGKSVPSNAVFTDTTYSAFTAATANAAGAAGLVPAPAAGDQFKFLRGDKTWTEVTPSLIGASASGHTHNYAGSSSAGGAATSANKINTDAGSETQPVYFSNGVPVATTYTLGKSVPSDAVFTDNDYRVKSTVKTTTKGYILASTSNSTVTGETIKDTGVYLDTTAGYITATRFNGPATKLTSTSVGSATQGVYFDENGVPVAMTYSVNKTVPSDAVFTDTNTKVTNTLGTTTKAYVTGTTSSTTNTGTQIFDTGVYLDTTAGHLTATQFNGALNGKATSAGKLQDGTTDYAVGSATQPVYFSDGVPVATTYTLGKSVPSNAVFTDTNTKVTNTLATTTKAYVTGTSTATTNTGTQVFDTGVYLDTTAGHLTATQFNGALNGKANTAGKLHSAVNITVGNKTNSFDGSAAISFSLSDIGAAASSHGTHVSFSNTAPAALAASASVGSASTVARSDHVHPLPSLATLGAASSSHSHDAFTGASANAAGAKGFVPAPAAGDEAKFLRADGSWAAASYSDFTGATSSADGSSGLVPAPTSTEYNYFLRGDGTWQPVAADVTSPHQTSGTVANGYYHRNIAYGTSSTPTSDATYGGSGAMYVYYT